MSKVFEKIRDLKALNPFFDKGWLKNAEVTAGSSMAGVSFTDFAGAGVVHVTGGSAALLGAYFIGPRVGRYKVKTTKKSEMLILIKVSKYPISGPNHIIYSVVRPLKCHCKPGRPARSGPDKECALGSTRM